MTRSKYPSYPITVLSMVYVPTKNHQKNCNDLDNQKDKLSPPRSQPFNDNLNTVS